MPSLRTEVVVLGAGPAGCIAARQLGRAGLDVMLIDGGGPSGSHAVETFPASGAALAEEIGLLPTLCDLSDGPAARMHMRWRDTPETREFDGAGPLLLRRDALHKGLRSDAQEVARLLKTRARRVDVTGDRAEVSTDAGIVACALVVDARGRVATKRRSADLVALPFCAQMSHPDRTMWLESLAEGWIWACNVLPDRVFGALFQKAGLLSGRSAQVRLYYARQTLAASEFFSTCNAVTVGTPSAAGFSAADTSVPAPRHLRIGDAAIARDPIASHGLVHAMRSAVQAAVAVQTILDPAGDSHAALSFLRVKHAEAIDTARRATDRAYEDQSRFGGPFWQARARVPDKEQPVKLGAGPVTLAVPLTRAPVLDRDRIRWAPAIELPASRDVFTAFGPVTALDIATACRPSASLQDIALRLNRNHARPVVFQVLEHLTLGGAFVQVPSPSSSRATARRMSQP